MPSYQELLDDASSTLSNSSDTPRIDAEILLQHVLDKPLAWLIANGGTSAISEHIKSFYEIVECRRQGQPVAYLLGYRDFWTLRLAVNDNVLIPRPDTETLVEQALERLSPLKQQAVLELGTGSGAIALAIAKERPLANVLASDYSDAALAVAKGNAKSNRIDNVQFMQSDWFAAIKPQAQFDLIAANPPYVDNDDPHIQQGDLRFEPNLALVADEEGLADLRYIIEHARHFLKPGGFLIVEHGFEQGEEIAQFFKHHAYTDIQLYMDINQLPRCTAAQWQA